MDSLEQSVALVAEPWRGSGYYDEAEAWTFLFWSDEYLVVRLLRQMDLTATLELACGHGRHAERVVGQAKRLVLMDVLQENVDFCRARFADHPEVEIYRNSGYDFAPVEAASLTAIFSYDAMVHFSPDIVEAYLIDSARVLKPGGMALYHHSNYDAPPDRHYGQNPHARNHMTEALFRDYAARAGLEIVSTTAVPWSGVEDLDRITLLRRP
ncbi:class I SAM-dependent methyltransferase [Bosea sp. 117]|uniref:class I SAM-dependent methyltransferase n=1 Tax=Bosea sp. 117 TaxID=1125973 RepID=UPI00069155B4|nr:class I SAM-dependent methyltransferase [Bosea sp. 117]